jgi:hypothetical protein
MPKIVKPKARHAADIRRWQPDPVAEVIAFDRQTVRRSGHVGALPGTEIRIEVKMKLHHQRLGKRDRSFSYFGLGGALEYFPRIDDLTLASYMDHGGFEVEIAPSEGQESATRPFWWRQRTCASRLSLLLQEGSGLWSQTGRNGRRKRQLGSGPSRLHFRFPIGHRRHEIHEILWARCGHDTAATLSVLPKNRP